MGVSKSDMLKRAQGYAEKKAKLKNPNFSVSRTRLSIRNIPTTVDEKQYVACVRFPLLPLGRHLLIDCLVGW